MTRYVLLALSTYMNTDGGNAFPSQSKLAEKTGLAKRTVNEHLERAEADGWIARRRVRRRARIWHFHRYEPRFPSFLAYVRRDDEVTETHRVLGVTVPVDKPVATPADKVSLIADAVNVTT